MGSSFEAFNAGYEPETTATTKVVTKAENIAVQGVTKSNFNSDAIPYPADIPKIIPKKPPI